VSEVRVYVNGAGHGVPPDSTAIDAVRAADPVEADAIARGERTIADSRGLPIANDDPVFAGAIYRTVRAPRPDAPTERPDQ
jgi:hypothetical protein